MAPPTRRLILLLPLLLASCGGDDDEGDNGPVSHREFPPLRYGYLPPIPLNVRRVDIDEGFTPPEGDNEISGDSPVSPAATLFAMARDRLKPVGSEGKAVFHILAASITRHDRGIDGMLDVRLDIQNADGHDSGYAEARVTATRSGSIPDQRAAAYDMLKSMMNDMNVEFEYQIRKRLRTWVAGPKVETPSAASNPGGVAPTGSSPAGANPSGPGSAGTTPVGPGQGGSQSGGSAPTGEPKAGAATPAGAGPFQPKPFVPGTGGAAPGGSGIIPPPPHPPG
jgi:hypothetical protein